MMELKNSRQKRLQLLEERRNMRGSAMDISVSEYESVCAELKNHEAMQDTHEANQDGEERCTY